MTGDTQGRGDILCTGQRCPVMHYECKMHCGVGSVLSQVFRPTEKEEGIYMGAAEVTKAGSLPRAALAKTHRWSGSGGLAGCAGLKWSTAHSVGVQRPCHHQEKLID